MNKSERMTLPNTIKTIVDLLQWRAQEQPGKRAYTFWVDGETQEQHLTYSELDQQARALAARLQTLAAPGERALLLYPPGLAFLTGFFGCLYAGLIAVPAYPPHAKRPMPRLHSIARDARPRLALTTQSIESNIQSQFADHPELPPMTVLATDALPVDGADAWQPPTVNTDSLAFLQYTSGSTGNAKGVMISHGNILHNEAMMAVALNNHAGSTGVSWLPVFHDMGLIGNVLQPLYMGVPIVSMSPVDFLQKPIRWLQAITRYRATCNAAPNFGYELCVQNIKPEQCEGLDLSSWEVALCGAEPVRPETVRRFSERFAPYGFRPEIFYPTYGLAEATLFVSGGLTTEPPVLLTVDKQLLETEHRVKPDPNGGQIAVGCGRSWLGQQIAIVNPDTLTRCPDGQVGEIWVAGPSVAQGYWQQPDATAETFQAHLADSGEGPFLRTGDLGFCYEGELFVTGRIKDLIIIRGRNHYPQDIEQTVEKSHQALQPGSGAAFSVEIKGEERLVIAHEVKRSHLRSLNVDEVLGNIRQAIVQEHQLQPYATLLLKPGTLPKTSSGKIQRRACREGFLNESLAPLNQPVRSATHPVPRLQEQRTETPVKV
jgi:acyl-CoA synthetase (AMP-forming)/AMP-acid ligase II